MLLLVLAATSAWASPNRAPVFEPVGEHEGITRLQLGTPRGNATCELGELGPSGFFITYVLPPDDQYFTLIDPSTCANCGGVVTAVEAWAVINFRVSCAQPLSVAIYGGINVNDCWVPNLDQPLCPETYYTATPPSLGNFFVGMPLPAGCCISGPAFLKITFVDFGNNCSTFSTIPRLVASRACRPCESYNYSPTDGGPYELCGVGFPGNPIFYLDAQCCLSTPTRQHSWGSLKGIYR
jgi:hypothetical protein